MAEQEVLLEVRDLCKNFKVRSRKIGESAQLLHALSHVNLKVYRGETLGVIGESGCGKSTLGRCIVGLHTPSSGQLVFEGKPLNFKAGGGQGKALRRKIQMIFQDPYSSLDPRKTCGKIVEEPMIIHKTVTDSVQRQERVRELMSVVGLDAQHVHRFPHEFSGGQRQRINIARALSLNPDLLVCDEPVSALDVSIQAQILNLMMDLQDEMGLTYMFVTHNLSVIKHISNNIAVMYLGQCVEHAPTNELFAHPQHPYTKALLNAITIASLKDRKKLEIIKGEVTSPINPKPGCRFADRCPYVTDRCREDGLKLREVAPKHYVACRLHE